jgi:hypothetical protein
MNDDIIVHLDMDGVLVGLNEGYQRISKGMSFDEYAEKYGRPAAIVHFLKRNKDFWADLPWERGGEEVYQTAKRLYKDVRVLSSTGTGEINPRFHEIKEGKLKWVAKYGLEFAQVVIVPDRHEKQRHATPMSILVDDVASTIKEWDDQAGTGILHDSRRYHRTLIELEEYSKPLFFSEIAKRAAHWKS